MRSLSTRIHDTFCRFGKPFRPRNGGMQVTMQVAACLS
jgi:hypothetical protein